MKNTDVIKSVVSIAVIIALAVLIVNMDKMVPTQNLPKVAEDSIAPASKVDYGECFSESPDTVVFIHSNSCPHCRTMMPIIQELEGEGYEFYWAEGSDYEAREVITNCLSDLVGGYVPQFICPKTGVEQTGAMSKAELKKFADNCI